MLELAIDGYGRLPGAKTAAAKHLQRHGGSVDDAIDSIIEVHVRLASAQGFVTNLGGVAAMAVTVPANLAGVAVLQVRMVAAIAHLRGYDVDDNRVRTALVMCLLGGEQIAKRIVEGKLPTSPMTVATAPMFDPDLDRVVAEEVSSGLASRVGGRDMALMRDQAGAAARRRRRRGDGRVRDPPDRQVRQGRAAAPPRPGN